MRSVPEYVQLTEAAAAALLCLCCRQAARRTGHDKIGCVTITQGTPLRKAQLADDYYKVALAAAVERSQKRTEGGKQGGHNSPGSAFLLKRAMRTVPGDSGHAKVAVVAVLHLLVATHQAWCVHENSMYNQDVEPAKALITVR